MSATVVDRFVSRGADPQCRVEMLITLTIEESSGEDAAAILDAAFDAARPQLADYVARWGRLSTNRPPERPRATVVIAETSDGRLMTSVTYDPPFQASGNPKAHQFAAGLMRIIEDLDPHAEKSTTTQK
ncbi:MAG: hypothetical protein AB7F40_10220 [Victivallaceae bacterium]